MYSTILSVQIAKWIILFHFLFESAALCVPLRRGLLPRM